MQLPHLAGRRAPGASFLAGRTPLIRPGPDAAAIARIGLAALA